MMVMGIKIPRDEVDILCSFSDWLLIYGRRKTGKSFLIRNFLIFDEYYFVSRQGKVYELKDDKFASISYEVFLDRVQRGMQENKAIVVDEFHRLPADFQDLLHALKPRARGQIILVTSSLFFVERILGPRSPLLGIVIPIRIDIINPANIIRELSRAISDPAMVLKLSIFAREPLLLSLISPTSNFDDFLAKLAITLKDVVPALIGEVFIEEKREITERYEAIMKALAVGNNTPSSVASYISGIIGGRLSSSDVKSYLRILERMGIVTRVRIYGKNRYLYKLSSPMIRLYYYLNEKLGYGEMDLSPQLIVREIKKLIPIYYEELVVEFMAKILNGTVEKTLKNEIDGIVTQKKRAIAVLEVKMGGISPDEVLLFEEKVERLRIKVPKIIVAKNKPELDKGIVSLSPHELIVFAHEPSRLQRLILSRQ